MNVAIALASAALAASPGGSTAGTAAVSGVVLDGAGQPLADVRIGFLSSRDATYDVFDAPFPDDSVRTDAHGRFSLRAPQGHVAIAAARGDVRTGITLRLTPVRVTRGGARTVVRFDGIASIRGRALDEAGRPLARVRVTAIPERTDPAAARGDAIVVRVWTADDGTFLLAGLAPGDHRLLARGAGHNCVEACEYGNGMRVRTGPGVVNVPLVAMGSVSGRVVQRLADGRPRPVPAFAVVSPAFGARELEPDDGQFDVDVPRLWSEAPLFVQAPGLAPFATKFDLPRPVNVDLGEIALGPGRTVRGRVRDASGGRVEGATVRVGFAKGALDEPVAVTDANGVFEISGVSQGAAALTVAHPRFRPKDVVAAPGPSELDVLLSRGIDLRLRVEDVDGTPLAGARVWNVISRTECRTGSDGACTLTGLEQREQVLEVGLPGAPRPPLHQLRVPVRTDTPPPVTVRLPRRPSVLQVTVVEPGGTFAQATVEIIPGEVAPERAVGSSGKIEIPYHASGIDLVKHFENLPPRSYTVVARSFATPQRCTVRIVELAEGVDQALTVKLPAERGPCRP